MLHMTDINTEALRRIEEIVFDCTIAYDRRLVMIQDILYQLQAMQDARSNGENEYA